MSTRCWIAAALLLAAVCTHAPGQAPPAQVKAKLEMRIYQVADLIIPLEKDSTVVNLPPAAPAAPVQQTAAAVPASPKSWSAGTPASPMPCPTGAATPAVSSPATVPQGTLEKRLIQLLTSRVAPESWNARGGPGTADYYPLGMALVVNQTPEVHKQIRHLLESLRKLQDVEVALEVRFVKVSEPVCERIGIDCNGDGKTGEGKPAAKADANLSSLSAGATFLNEKQLYAFMEMVQGDQRANVMQAPKLTVANGQRAEMKVEDQQYFVTGVEAVRKDGQTVLVPKNEPMKTGFQLSVQPAVSADRRYVQLALKVVHTDQASAVVPLFPIVIPVTPKQEDGSKGQPVVFTQFIQQPVFNSVTLEKTLVIPDSQTVLLGGWKSVREARTEFGDPVLSKIPYVNRLFKTVGYGRETETVLLLVTPRIIVNERHETAAVKAEGKGEKSKEKKVAKLLEKYEQACKEGKLEEAKKLARKALELDPSCFAHGKHEASNPDRSIKWLNESEDLKEIEREWEQMWFNDQPSHLTPERVHGGVGP
jgi:general secretion pathway protein D